MQPPSNPIAILAAILVTVGGPAGLAGTADKDPEAETPPPQSQPAAPQGDAPAQTQPASGPQSAPATTAPNVPKRRQQVLDQLRLMGIDPNKSKVRYEKGTFMITGSIEIDPKIYDSKPLVAEWIKKIETLWLPKLPLAAKMGNQGRSTFKGVLVRDKGIQRIEKIEPSGLDSFDQAAAQALEEFRSSLVMPPDFPGDYFVFYMKFHYNVFSEF